MRVLAVCLCLIPLALQADPTMLARRWAEPVSLARVRVIAHQPAASRIAQALTEAGADVVVTAPDDAMADNGIRWRDDIADRTILVLGGIHTNRAVLPLYGDYLCFADLAYPGADGYVVRTIQSPAGPDTAAIALEASSAAGEQAAIDRFAEMLKDADDLLLPRTIEAHLSEERAVEVRKLGPSAIRYVLTGAEADAKAGFDALIKSVGEDGSWFQYGDYGIERYVREYGHLQDAPGITPEQVLALDAALLKTVLSSEGMYWRRTNGSSIGSRHQTMGTSCITACVQLMNRRCQGNDEATALVAKWWAECIDYWRNVCSTFHDDLEGIPSYYSPETFVDWALSMGFDGFLRDQLPLVARRVCSIVDNLGYYAGTGTYEECRPGDLYKPVPRGWLLSVASFFHPGAGFDWFRDNSEGTSTQTWAVARNFTGVRTFASPEQVSRRPDDWLGISVAPMGEYRYARYSHDREKARAANQWYITAPQDKTFEKLCLRDNFDTGGQYLVFQGLQGVPADNSPPLDCNALVRYTDLGHIWLHSNSEKADKLVRTAVFCSDGLNDSRQPAGCELQAMHNGDRIGLAASHLPDLNGCDWTRNVIWRRGEYFVLIDLMQQQTNRDLSLICTFRTPQPAWLTSDGMIAREEHARMVVRNADAVRLSLAGGDELEGAAVPTLLRQTQALPAGEGAVGAFRNLVYSADPDHPAELEIQPLAASAAMIRGNARGRDELALIAAALPGQALDIPEIETDAQVLYVGADEWAQAGGTFVSIDDMRLEGSGGATPSAVAQKLGEMWQGLSPVERPGAGEIAPDTARVAWRYEGFTHTPAPAPAPILTSDPEGSGNIHTILDRVVTRWASYTWPARQDISLTVDLREPQRIRQIDFQTGTFGSINEIPDPATYPGPRTVRATFSSDDFVGDVREQQLTFTSDCTFEGLHKGVVYPILRWTASDIALEARQVRLEFSADQWPSLGMNEFSVRPEGPNAARIAGFVIRDADRDGKGDVLAWTDRSELVLVRADGTPMMMKRMPGYITSAECYEGIADDGPRVLVTTREARLYCLKTDGTELWRTDFLDSAKLNGDLPIGYSTGLLEDPEGNPLIMVGNYNLASFVSPQGKVLKYERLPAAYQTMTLPHGLDFNGDGIQEILTCEVWGCLSVLDATMKRTKLVYVPRGAGRMLEYFGSPDAETPRAILCTEAGVRMVNLKSMEPEWGLNVQPISDCALADVDGDGVQEILLAKPDGYVLIYSDTGQLIRSHLIGEPVRAVAGVDLPGGTKGVYLAVPGRIVALAEDGATRTVAVGEYSRLAPGSEPGQLLAFGTRALIEAIQVQ